MIIILVAVVYSQRNPGTESDQTGPAFGSIKLHV